MVRNYTKIWELPAIFVAYNQGYKIITQLCHRVSMLCQAKETIWVDLFVFSFYIYVINSIS